MFMQRWKSEIITVPNLLSLFRLALIPVYLSIYRRAVHPHEFCTAAVILSVSCLTDALDGYIARRCNMVSSLGKFLDPLADKLTQFVLILCLAARYPSVKPVFLLFLVKEITQIFLAGIRLHQGMVLPGALPAGKLCTTVLFLSMILLVFLPDLDSAAVKAVAAVDCFFLLTAFAGYLFAYLGAGSLLQNLKSD